MLPNCPPHKMYKPQSFGVLPVTGSHRWIPQTQRRSFWNSSSLSLDCRHKRHTDSIRGMFARYMPSFDVRRIHKNMGDSTSKTNHKVCVACLFQTLSDILTESGLSTLKNILCCRQCQKNLDALAADNTNGCVVHEQCDQIHTQDFEEIHSPGPNVHCNKKKQRSKCTLRKTNYNDIDNLQTEIYSDGVRASDFSKEAANDSKIHLSSQIVKTNSCPSRHSITDMKENGEARIFSPTKRFNRFRRRFLTSAGNTSPPKRNSSKGVIQTLTNKSPLDGSCEPTPNSSIFVSDFEPETGNTSTDSGDHVQPNDSFTESAVGCKNNFINYNRNVSKCGFVAAGFANEICEQMLMKKLSTRKVFNYKYFTGNSLSKYDLTNSKSCKGNDEDVVFEKEVKTKSSAKNCRYISIGEVIYDEENSKSEDIYQDGNNQQYTKTGAIEKAQGQSHLSSILKKPQNNHHASKQNKKPAYDSIVESYSHNVDKCYTDEEKSDKKCSQVTSKHTDIVKAQSTCSVLDGDVGARQQKHRLAISKIDGNYYIDPEYNYTHTITDGSYYSRPQSQPYNPRSYENNTIIPKYGLAKCDDHCDSTKCKPIAVTKDSINSQQHKALSLQTIGDAKTPLGSKITINDKTKSSKDKHTGAGEDCAKSPGSRSIPKHNLTCSSGARYHTTDVHQDPMDFVEYNNGGSFGYNHIGDISSEYIGGNTKYTRCHRSKQKSHGVNLEGFDRPNVKYRPSDFHIQRCKAVEDTKRNQNDINSEDHLSYNQGSHCLKKTRSSSVHVNGHRPTQDISKVTITKS